MGIFKRKRKRWIDENGGYSEFKDGKILTDKEVADALRKKMPLLDRLNFDKVVSYALTQHAVLSEDLERSKEGLAIINDYTKTGPTGF